MNSENEYRKKLLSKSNDTRNSTKEWGKHKSFDKSSPWRKDELIRA